MHGFALLGRAVLVTGALVIFARSRKIIGPQVANKPKNKPGRSSIQARYCCEMHSGVICWMPNENAEPHFANGEGQTDPQKELIKLSSEIRVLKLDVRELSELLRLLTGFIPMPASGTEEEKVAIGFETRLAAMLDKHSAGHLRSQRKDAIEGTLLISK